VRYGKKRAEGIWGWKSEDGGDMKKIGRSTELGKQNGKSCPSM